VTTEAQEPEPLVQPRRWRPRALTVLGVVLLAAGLACLSWVGYQFIGTDVVSQRSYDREKSGLRTQ
jgi:sortase A